MLSEFRPIFFERDFALTEFYGWRELFIDDDIRILAIKRGPICRYLVLSWGRNAKTLEKIISDKGLINLHSEVFVQDFTDNFDERFADWEHLTYDFRRIAGKMFKKANDEERLLNKSTFIIDLSLSEDELFKNIGSKSRNMVRRAQKENSVIEFGGHADNIDIFYRFYDRIMESTKLSIPNRDIINNLIISNKLICAVSIDKNGYKDIVNLIYICGKHAYYLFGASAGRPQIGSGQLLQWEIMKLLKAQGVLWDDLGGVRTADESNGIYQFKKGFGGELVHWGDQFVYRPGMVSALGAIRSMSRAAVDLCRVHRL